MSPRKDASNADARPDSADDVVVITRTDELQALCDALATAPYVTVDTEFMRETTFFPKLCLVQLAGPDRAAVVDPLADGIDLAPFYDLMANPGVMKVFHAARQDAEIVFNASGHAPAPLFDTQVAAMVLGYGDQIAYDQLVLRITGARIDKSSRFTDWSRRPLTDKQLRYALGDVTHLREVGVVLAEQLAERGRDAWIAEEMTVLSSAETYELRPEDAWRRLKMRLRKPEELAVMRAVAAWRERMARERDVPRNRVLKDDAIYEIAQQLPRDAAALGRLRAVPNGFERSRGVAGLLDAVSEALDQPREEMPRLPRREPIPEWVGSAVELLRVLLRLTADREGVVPRLIASADELETLAHKGEEADVRALTGWRRSLFGEHALRLVRGELALRFVEGKVDVAEVREPDET